ncbi:hypothetical protein AB0I72_19530 [Nocardiopsis sp. NPDC049922]|uniref:hypothetical protein n=1 Tax=Nocardiopsis sp. NPDC049922 TaxID=3155157 RepID=UPI0033F1FDBC
MTSEQPPERVALRRYMEERQEELGLEWTEIAEIGGTNDETLRRVRTGVGKIQMKTRKAIEKGLQWAPGSVNTILSGGRPLRLEEQGAGAYITTTPQGGQQLWLTVSTPGEPQQQMMIPLDTDSVAGLHGLTDADRASLTHQMLGVMVHAGRAFLEEQGRRRLKEEEG